MFGSPKTLEEAAYVLLQHISHEFGIDLNDPNFKDTPKRIAKSYREILRGSIGTQKQIDQILATSFPSEGYNDIIFCPEILSFGLCPHHFLPVEYKTSLGYIPGKEGKVLGASKLARIVNILSAQPLMQETVTTEIVKALKTAKPQGVAVVMSGTHYCMRMRGVKQQSPYATSSMFGQFRDSISTKEEFFELLKHATRR